MKRLILLTTIIIAALSTQAQISNLYNDKEFDEFRIRKHLLQLGYGTEQTESMINSFKGRYFKRLEDGVAHQQNTSSAYAVHAGECAVCSCFGPTCLESGTSNNCSLLDPTLCANPFFTLADLGNFFDADPGHMDGWCKALANDINDATFEWKYGSWTDFSNPVNRHRLNSNAAERDPFTNELIIPKGSKNSVTMGNGFFGLEAEKLSTKFTLNRATDTTFNVNYSVVLFDPPIGHGEKASRPYFSIRVYVKAPGSSVFYEDCCEKFEVYSSPDIPGFKRSESDPTIVFKPWSSKVIDLTKYVDGSEIVVEFTTHHCAWGPHFAYAHVDGKVNGQQMSKKGQLCRNSVVKFTSPVFGSYKKEKIQWIVEKYNPLAGTYSAEYTGTEQHVIYPAYLTMQEIINSPDPALDAIRNAINFPYTFVPLDTEFPAKYRVTAKVWNDDPVYAGCGPAITMKEVFIYDCEPLKLECEDCIQSFAPVPGRKYVLSAWVKEKITTSLPATYASPEIYVYFNGVGTVAGPFKGKGGIIDGWQRVEESFTIPIGTSSIEIELKNTSGANNDIMFDDVRVFPFDGTVKSFVYNPGDLKLLSELDENNYATFYDYDEEGNLVRVRRETIKGVQTVKEIFTNTSKE